MTTLPKLLIAEGDSELRSALAEALSKKFLVKSCGDGCRTRELLQSFHPDLLLLDLMLPNVDGITLLREIPEEKRPVTVAIIPFPSPYIQTALQQLQVSYLFMKPMSISAITDRMQELAASILPAPPAPAEPEDRLYSLLRSMRLAPHADGFSYLMESIPLYQKDPRQSMTKELYPEVGRRFQKSSLCVERSIRSAVEGAWRRGGYQSWNPYFPTMPDGTVAKPSNKTFICAVAAALAQQEKDHARAI